MDMKNYATVTSAFLSLEDNDFMGEVWTDKFGQPLTAGDIMAARRRKNWGNFTPNIRMGGVGLRADGESTGWRSRTPTSRGGMGMSSPLATPKSGYFRGNFSPKSLSSRRGEDNSSMASQSLRRKAFKAPPLSPPPPLILGGEGRSIFTENSTTDASNSLVTAEGMMAKDDDSDPAVSDDEFIPKNTYRQHSDLNAVATAEAVSSLRQRTPMSMNELIRTGNLSTLEMAGAGDLRPTNTGRGIRETLQEETKFSDIIASLQDELLGPGRRKHLVTGRHDASNDEYIGNARLRYDVSFGMGEDEKAPTELNEIQKGRRRVIVGQDVDYQLEPRQKKEMRALIEDTKTTSLIEEKLARKKQWEEDKMMRRIQADWTWNLKASKYFRILAEKFKARLEVKEEEKKKNTAAKKIQEAWEIYFAPIRTEKKRRIQVTLMKFSFRLLARLSRVRLRLAKRKVLKFYSDFSRQRFSFVMVKFRFNCIKLQRRIRSYHLCTKARVLVLSVLWNKIEPEIKASIEKAINTHLHGSYSDKWKGHISLARFPELAQKINTVTTDCVALKKTIQKGVNTVTATLPALLAEEKRLRAEYLKKMGKGKRQSAIGRAMSELKSIVPEAEKTNVIKRWLTNRRSDHGEYAWNLTRGGKVKATQLNMINAAKMISGELDIRDHVEYTNNKIRWPTFLMLTNEDGVEEFREMVTEAIAIAIEQRNKEIQAMVRKRLQSEMKKEALKLSELPGGYRWIKEEDIKGGGKKKENLPKGKRHKTEVFGGGGEGEQGLVMGSTPIGTPTNNLSDKNKRGGGGGGGGDGEGKKKKKTSSRTKRVVEPKKKRAQMLPVTKTHTLAAAKPITLEVPNF